MPVTEDGYRFIERSLIEQNGQLRALLARSLPVMQSMSHTINEEYNHCNEDWQIDEIREQAKTLGVEVQE